MLRYVFALAAIVGLLAYNFSVVFLALAIRLEADGARAYGFLNMAIAIGSMIGATAAMRLPIGSWIVAGWGMGLGASLVTAALAPNLAVCLAAAAILGVCSMGYVVGSTTVLQRTSVRAFRGRVLSIQLLLMVGTTPIGSPLIGALIDAAGAPVAISSVGAVCVFLVLAIALTLRPRKSA
jgi:MFS family permease